MLSIVLAVIAGVKAVFTLVSLIGAGTTKDVLKNMYWTKVHGGGNTGYFGLLALDQDLSYSYNDGVFLYSDSDCTGNICDQCGSAGAVVMTFGIISLISFIVVLVIQILRSYSKYQTFTYKLITVVATAVALLASIVSITTWGGQCQATVADDNDGATISVGPGFGLAIVVTILCILSLSLDIVFSFCLGSSNSTLATPLNPNQQTFNGQIINPVSGLPAVSKPVHCSFCGKKGAREYPIHPDETTRYCSACGKKHIVEPGIRFCSSCGAELQL